MKHITDTLNPNVGNPTHQTLTSEQNASQCEAQHKPALWLNKTRSECQQLANRQNRDCKPFGKWLAINPSTPLLHNTDISNQQIILLSFKYSRCCEVTLIKPFTGLLRSIISE